jgi:hypothetical protein
MRRRTVSSASPRSRPLEPVSVRFIAPVWRGRAGPSVAQQTRSWQGNSRHGPSNQADCEVLSEVEGRSLQNVP